MFMLKKNGCRIANYMFFSLFSFEILGFFKFFFVI
jgi:hypothetical protein